MDSALTKMNQDHDIYSSSHAKHDLFRKTRTLLDGSLCVSP